MALCADVRLSMFLTSKASSIAFLTSVKALVKVTLLTAGCSRIMRDITLVLSYKSLKDVLSPRRSTSSTSFLIWAFTAESPTIPGRKYLSLNPFATILIGSVGIIFSLPMLVLRMSLILSYLRPASSKNSFALCSIAPISFWSSNPSLVVANPVC